MLRICQPRKQLREEKGQETPRTHRLRVQLSPTLWEEGYDAWELPFTTFRRQKWFRVDSAGVWGAWMNDVIVTQSPHWGTVLRDPGSSVCSAGHSNMMVDFQRSTRFPKSHIPPSSLCKDRGWGGSREWRKQDIHKLLELPRNRILLS